MGMCCKRKIYTCYVCYCCCCCSLYDDKPQSCDRLESTGILALFIPSYGFANKTCVMNGFASAKETNKVVKKYWLLKSLLINMNETYVRLRSVK